jgi:hypothetical protein
MSLFRTGDQVRVPSISAETAQTLVGVTITSMVLLTAVTAANGPAAATWASVVIAGLVTAVSGSLLHAVHSCEEGQRRSTEDREEAQALARHVEASASAIRSEMATLRNMTGRVSVLEAGTTVMSTTIDRTENLIDDLETIVAAATGTQPQAEVVDVWRAVRKALPLDVRASGDESAFALASRRALHTSLRLIASTFPAMGAITATVQTGEGQVKVTLASEDVGLEAEETASIFGPTPTSPFRVEGPMRSIAMARFVARHTGGDVAYVRALGRSHYVVSMPAVETREVDETPPILTLTLPLDAGGVETSSARSLLRD